MRDRPIIMSGESVRAILAGTKSQTRRVVKPQPDDEWMSFAIRTWGSDNAMPIRDQKEIRCPFGQRGDRLWVRETWGVFPPEPEATASDWCIRYRATPDAAIHWRDNADIMGYDGVDSKWKSPMFMPHRFSRITLKITGKRVEYLQAITEEDAIAEGCQLAEGYEELARVAFRQPYREVYRDWWQELNAKRFGCSWDDNPFVWVVSFSLLT